MAKNQTKPMPEEAGSKPRKKASDYLDDDDLDEGEELDEPAPDQDSMVDLNFLELVAEIGKRYQPAASFEEAGLQLTTGEVLERLKTFYPADTYGAKLVFEALTKLGFIYDDPFRDLNFRWLFK